MKRILINATHEEELRIAIANGQYLEDLIIESTRKEQKQSNIYKGTITRIEPSLEAAFVDYGEGRHGFLSSKEIARSCFKASYQDNGRRPAIQEIADEGQELILQIKKEERDLKGAALTTFISLPGCYLVLMPNNPRAGGISRRIDDEERNTSHEILSKLQVPNDMGVILRTAGSGRKLTELQWDLDILIKQWDAINQVSAQRRAPFLIYQEGNAVIRTLRDYLRPDIDEIIIDHQEIYEKSLAHLTLIRPDFINKVKLYKDSTPLFNRFQIESQIESAFQREVRLPSGGSIVIDRTEALFSIDINSAKATKGGDIEETASNTNMEAADEIARQLRLRDISGLIVIDFIDMHLLRNQREVEERLKNALDIDRARVQIGRISRFGLLEMSRQRLRSALGEASYITCPRCSGQGRILGIESLALSVIRLIEEEALKENTAQVRAILPAEIATYILNEKRQAILDIEKRHLLHVVVISNPNMVTPQYTVERIKTSDTSEDNKVPSYKFILQAHEDQAESITPKQVQEPAVKGFINQAGSSPAPTISQAQNKLLQPLQHWLRKLVSFVLNSLRSTKNTPPEQRHVRKKYGNSNNTKYSRGRYKKGYARSHKPTYQQELPSATANNTAGDIAQPVKPSAKIPASGKQKHTREATAKPRTNDKHPKKPIPLPAVTEENTASKEISKEPSGEKNTLSNAPSTVQVSEKKMRFYPGKNQTRRFSPSEKSVAMRRGKVDSVNSNNSGKADDSNI